MNKAISAFILFCCLLCTAAFGQYYRPENKVWVMGNASGVDFSGAVPVPINTSIKSMEGCASICNETGSLLFYTNGSEVWNANGSFMLHGQNITGVGIGSTLSTTQGALIVPDVKRCGVYYIFSLTQGMSMTLFCSKVNMNLNNGLGGIDTSFSLWRVPLRGGLSEKMIAVKSREDSRIWILVHHASEPEFYAYPLSVTGLDTVPVTSIAGAAANYVFGTMKVDPATDQLAVCNQVGGSNLALYDFDGASGNVAFEKMIDSTCAAYGGTFSPDGTKLYVWNINGICQYNLNLAYPAPAKTVLGLNKLSDMKLAINGKIYFISAAGLIDAKYYLGSIESPNSLGTACQYRDSVTNLFFPEITPGITRLNLGLPNEVVGNPSYQPNSGTVYNQTYCSFPASGITFQAEGGYSNYLWDNGTTGSIRAVNQAGIYWVRYDTYCGPQTDTFKVSVEGLPLSITYSNGLLSVPNIYSSYQWYHAGTSIPGANQSSYMATSTGWYSVLVHKENLCTDSAAYLVSSLTGINNPGEEQVINIFPNPAQDYIYIKSAEPVDYRLYSAEGKIVALGKGNTVDVAKIARGLYILKLSDADGRYLAIQKIFLQ
jgi:hypothetical protein